MTMVTTIMSTITRMVTTMKWRRRMIHFTRPYAGKRLCSPDMSTRTATGGDLSTVTGMITRQLRRTQ
jgi:hypothetical protein